MDTKILFFDIDGTILSHRNYRILNSTKRAIKKVQERGHLAFINTGRTYSEIDEEIKDFGFDGFVCGCGTCIYYKSSILFHASLDKSLGKNIIEDLQALDINAILEGNEAVYFSKAMRNPKMKYCYDMYNNRGFNVQTWDDIDAAYDKFCIWIDTMEPIKEFCLKYQARFDFINRENLFFEVVPKSHSKASGMEYLISHLNIPHANTYAFGDSSNDRTMLTYAAHSIGMGNSEEEIKKIVSYITKDVDEDGIAHALRHYHLI